MVTTKDQAIAPPYGSKREAAKAVYTPPFKYQYGYIFDSQNLMVADYDNVEGAGVGFAVGISLVWGLFIASWPRLGEKP